MGNVIITVGRSIIRALEDLGNSVSHLFFRVFLPDYLRALREIQFRHREIDAARESINRLYKENELLRKDLLYLTEISSQPVPLTAVNAEEVSKKLWACLDAEKIPDIGQEFSFEQCQEVFKRRGICIDIIEECLKLRREGDTSNG